jgi:hypothetical protein
MANVQIKCGSDVKGCLQIIVDGHDLSNDVLVEGFHIETPNDPDGFAQVHVVIAADTLEVELPEAVVNALRHPGES